MTQRMKKTLALAASIGFAATLALPTLVAAQTGPSSADLGVDVLQGRIALSGNRNSDLRQTAGRIINVALGFLGIIAVVIVLVGGFKYMLSGGNETKTADARNLIFSGIIGLAIILSAWAITNFVISKLMTATAE